MPHTQTLFPTLHRHDHVAYTGARPLLRCVTASKDRSLLQWEVWRVGRTRTHIIHFQHSSRAELQASTRHSRPVTVDPSLQVSMPLGTDAAREVKSWKAAKAPGHEDSVEAVCMDPSGEMVLALPRSLSRLDAHTCTPTPTHAHPHMHTHTCTPTHAHPHMHTVL